MSRQWSTQTKVAAITAAGVVLAACITGVVSLITAVSDKPPPGAPPAVAATVSSPVCLLGTWEMAEGGRRLNFQDGHLEQLLVAGSQRVSFRADGTGRLQEINRAISGWTEGGALPDLRVETSYNGSYAFRFDATGSNVTLEILISDVTYVTKVQTAVASARPLPLERKYELNYTCTADALTLRWASSTEFAQYYRR